MAEPKTAYPVLTIQTWWTLRRRFRQSVPSQVTAAYLHSVLGISEKTARDNELPTLRKLGLVDSNGNTTDRARRWRDDEQYAAVCEEIVKSAYSQELRDAVPDASDEEAAKRWFMNRGGVGEGAASRMAKTYRLLLEADPRKEPDTAAKPRTTSSGTPARGVQRVSTSRSLTRKNEGSSPDPSGIAASAVQRQHTPTPKAPSLHIDVQIHIAADASPAQIEQIFASMAKHLYDHTTV